MTDFDDLRHTGRSGAGCFDRLNLKQEIVVLPVPAVSMPVALATRRRKMLSAKRCGIATQDHPNPHISHMIGASGP